MFDGAQGLTRSGSPLLQTCTLKLSTRR